MTGKHKKTILIDLDGVLNTYAGEFDEHFIPEIKTGAKAFLTNLSLNYTIKLFTTRNRLLAAKWLIDNDLDNIICDITNVKELSWLFIDDRCLKFDGDFEALAKEIEKFKPYYRQY